MNRKIYTIDHLHNINHTEKHLGEIKEKQQSVARKEENKGMNQGMNEWNEKKG